MNIIDCFEFFWARHAVPLRKHTILIFNPIAGIQKNYRQINL